MLTRIEGFSGGYTGSEVAGWRGGGGAASAAGDKWVVVRAGGTDAGSREEEGMRRRMGGGGRARVLPEVEDDDWRRTKKTGGERRIGVLSQFHPMRFLKKVPTHVTSAQRTMKRLVKVTKNAAIRI
jgi:hypothetical protein